MPIVRAFKNSQDFNYKKFKENWIKQADRPVERPDDVEDSE
jgi:hypothetical protein